MVIKSLELCPIKYVNVMKCKQFGNTTLSALVYTFNTIKLILHNHLRS